MVVVVWCLGFVNALWKCWDDFLIGKVGFHALQCTFNGHNSFVFGAKNMWLVVLESLYYALSL